MKLKTYKKFSKFISCSRFRFKNLIGELTLRDSKINPFKYGILLMVSSVIFESLFGRTLIISSNNCFCFVGFLAKFFKTYIRALELCNKID